MPDSSLEAVAALENANLSPDARAALVKVKAEVQAQAPETWMEWTKNKVYAAMKWAGIGFGVAAVGAVATVGGGVLGFGYGAEKAAEVAPEVMVGVASRELDERTKVLHDFWETVKPLLLKIVSQIGDFLMKLKNKGSTVQGLQSGAWTLYNGLKNDGIEWLANGDTSLDRTVDEISKAVSADPDLGPQWEDIMTTYGLLKGKQKELPALTAQFASVTKEDRAQIEADVKREMKEAVLKDLPWATSSPESESQE